MDSTILLFCAFAIIWLTLIKVLPSRRKTWRSQNVWSSKLDHDDPIASKFKNIIPLPEFDWREAEPLKFRSFKAKFHMTLGTSRSTLSELIEIDRNYLSRLELRTKIISENFDTAIQASSECKPAVDELYSWLMSTYLPKRFPKVFSLMPSSLLNHATGLEIPLQPPVDPGEAFRILGENLDEEFLILMPPEDGDGYALKGYITCFSSGFNPKTKFNQKLRDIHKPVPEYKKRLGTSMDRFFDRLQVGQVVQRWNWTITTHGQLFVPSGNHMKEGEVPVPENIDISKTHLRCERHMLHRLPASKAIIFSFKTYLYPLREIKEEGLGEGLAQAIDGLKTGSVPAMHYYKRGVIWGDAVKEYLLS